MDIKGYIRSKYVPFVGNLKIYKPLYDYYNTLDSSIPKVYNKYGELYDFYFIRDIHMAATPYKDLGRYFIWDRYNWGLKTHFYTHNAMLQTMGCPDRQYGMLIESKAIVPNDYKIFKKHKGLEKEFDSIFTFDDEILNDVSNAKFYPACANVWYGKKGNDFIWNDLEYQQKSKNISILSSDKVMCELHKWRLYISRLCKKNGIADAFGTFDGGKYCTVDDTLKEYRYSIILENYVSDYFFTEKITNCFAAQTIPIYLGAKKIDEFFNKDGIICIEQKDLGNIEGILKQCTEKEYESRLPAILDNYQRVQEYANVKDYLYEHFLM